MDALWSVLIPAAITGLVSIVLFRAQMRKEAQQDSATVRKTIEEAGKVQSETWEMLVEDLREELARQKTVRHEKEKEFLDQINALRNQVDTNAQYFQELLEDERRLHLSIGNELRDDLNKLHKENKELAEQNKALTKLVNSQTEKIQILQEAKNALALDIKRLKQDTGELKRNGKKRPSDSN